LSISKIAPAGKAYACPLCGMALRPDPRYDILHCFPCDRSQDLWKIDDKSLAIIDAPMREPKDSEVLVSLTKQDIADLLNHVWDSRHSSVGEKILTGKLKLAMEKFE
jgi:hypothetical protein